MNGSKRILGFLVPAVLALAAGCATTDSFFARRAKAPYRGVPAVQPVVAVVDFEDLANFKGKWDLGRGMADVLVRELLRTERVTVIEREHLDDVLGEIVRQGRALFRKEGRVEPGRLKNAKYLVRGVITDFSETSRASGRARTGLLRLFGSGARARVAITVTVSDVETGEIISSVSAAKAVSSGGGGFEAVYKGLAFGGDAFFKTPLGRATEDVVTKAVRRVLRDLPVETWQPRVAEGGVDQVIVNGGENVRLREGDVFLVRERAREVTDPVTGNPIRTIPGQVLGKVRVTKVYPTSADAVLIEGSAFRGHVLEPVR